MRDASLSHTFVQSIPADLEDSILYICIEYATAVHKCCCGCGHKVVTPLSPTDWKVTYNGDTVSLSPSIGNWSFACKSHYWILNDTVSWADTWSKEQIDFGRAQDLTSKNEYFEGDKAKINGVSANKNWRKTLVVMVKSLWRW